MPEYLPSDWTFYIADPSDITYATPLVNFMEYDRSIPASYGFSVADGAVDLGTPSPEQVFLHQPPSSGGLLATSYYPEVLMSFNLFLVGITDYSVMLTKVSALNDALQAGGTIVWQPPGATEVRYIDFYPSRLPQLFRGQPHAMQKIVNLLLDPDGLPVEIMRFPWLRGPTAAAQTATLTNGALDGHIAFTNAGTAPSPMKLSINPVAGDSELVQIRAGLKSEGDLTDFATNYSFDPTLEETVLPKYWRRLWKQVITPSVPDGLVGNYRVLVSTQLLTASEYRLQLRWGNVSDDPMGASNEVIVLDNSDHSAWSTHADIPFGKVRYDPDGSSLTLEMWGLAPDNDSPEVDFGTVTLVPADEAHTNITSPGFRTGKFGREEIWGDMFDLVGYAQVMNDDSVRLFQNGGIARYSFGVLPTGKHIVAFHGHVTRGVPASDDPADDIRRTNHTVGYMYLYKNGVLDSTVRLRAIRGEPVSVWDHQRTRRLFFEADGSSTYRVDVQMTDATSQGRRLHVYKLVHWLVPFCDNNRVIVSDSFERDCYMADSGGARWLPMHAHGGLMKAAPGDNVIVMRFGNNANAGGFQDADERGPLSKVAGGSFDISVEVTPYYTS